MNGEHTAGQAPELNLRLPLQVSIFKMGLERVLSHCCPCYCFCSPGSPFLGFKREGAWQFLKPLLSFKFCGWLSDWQG